METSSLTVSPRTIGSSKAAARIRRSGSIPAVVYGDGKPVAHVSVPTEPFVAALRKHHRVFQIDLGDGATLAFLKAVQHDSLGDEILHVDFLRIDQTERLEVSVPLVFSGHPKGLSNDGEFVHPLSELEVRCLPMNIPESIRVVVEHLDLDMSILARDIVLPEGVELATDPEAIVCTVTAKALEVEPEAAVGEAGPAEPEMIEKRPADEDGEGAEAKDKPKEKDKDKEKK